MKSSDPTLCTPTDDTPQPAHPLNIYLTVMARLETRILNIDPTKVANEFMNSGFQKIFSNITRLSTIKEIFE